MENLILLHGALGSKNQFIAFLDYLKKDFNVILLDLEGHGSNEGEKGFSMEIFCRNVLRKMEENGIGKSHFFGYSMGGYIALYLAKHFPDRVGDIVCLGTKLKWDPKIAEKETKMLDIAKMEEKVPHFVNMLEKRHLNWKEVIRKTSKMMVDLGEGKGISMEEYRDISNRVLLMIGDKDNMVSKEETEFVSGLLLEGSWKILENTFHPIEKVDVEKISKIIKTYISKGNLEVE